MFVTYAARIQGYTIFPPKNNTYKLFTILKKKTVKITLAIAETIKKLVSTLFCPGNKYAEHHSWSKQLYNCNALVSKQSTQTHQPPTSASKSTEQA
jgi:hypothetical protein